ncbi:CDN_1a_G0016400.mRNA.1.CDS.1 [Saccharomyces cerevisiae]|nr:CDN_1a_G0016400.mRNA.1.CDS.1 [Saccharomyces cerevisiae]CAI4557355.1 ABH_G0029400.mRNA.1.CDS.1 [Saccharomyces cerevisiae]CAI6739205.1 ABH_G0029400.mRNA.1.CDS.1 [Saccharomyces cerevisiae]CAI7271469.1 CDN_1a_G0016400.mRNA.1.CDS.1 [Saccharomyces cerevisiae]
MNLHHYARNLPPAVYTLCYLRINPMIVHILIFIYHSAVPNIVSCITALNT